MKMTEEKIKGIFIEACNGPVEMYDCQNSRVLKRLREKYEIITYEGIHEALHEMKGEDAERCRDIAFMITNLPYTTHTPLQAEIRAEKIRKRLEGLIGERLEVEKRIVADEREFGAYEDTFEVLRKFKEVFPKMKIIAYTAAPYPVRKKAYYDNLVFSVHQRGHKSGVVWEANDLFHGVGDALEGGRGFQGVYNA
ncbi:hypothetical protein GF371_00785 [Candidatus Woesearchaeota archaeon]|nr:hypothetical protein [Candidatus Woesearchaeota archaeon]